MWGLFHHHCCVQDTEQQHYIEPVISNDYHAAIAIPTISNNKAANPGGTQSKTLLSAAPRAVPAEERAVPADEIVESGNEYTMAPMRSMYETDCQTSIRIERERTETDASSQADASSQCSAGRVHAVSGTCEKEALGFAKPSWEETAANRQSNIGSIQNMIRLERERSQADASSRAEASSQSSAGRVYAVSATRDKEALGFAKPSREVTTANRESNIGSIRAELDRARELIGLLPKLPIQQRASLPTQRVASQHGLEPSAVFVPQQGLESSANSLSGSCPRRIC